MCNCKTLINELTNRLTTLENELADVPTIVQKREARARVVQAERDQEMLALPPDELYPALMARDDRGALLRNLGQRGTNLVTGAPSEIRDELFAYLSEPQRMRVRLAMTPDPRYVWLQTARGCTVHLNAVEVTADQATALAEQGLDSIETWVVPKEPRHYRYTPPTLDSVIRRRVTEPQLELMCTVVPELSASIASGHLVITKLTRDETERSLLEMWSEDSRRLTGSGQWDENLRGHTLR
jgi:hypothetical protein